MMKRMLLIGCVVWLAWPSISNAAEPERPVLKLWPGEPPMETKKLRAEVDTTKPTDNLIAGKRLIRLGNVSTPTMTIYRPDPAKDTGATVVVCPGGGHYILAWDLEGTEVAEWLNTIGVTAIVLKYRVPARHPDRRWLSAVQDAQRCVSLVRSHAAEWKIDPDRVGILGFSAGGETAALTALFDERQYSPVDGVDKLSSKPNFAVLVYTGGLTGPSKDKLRDHVKVSAKSPPMFFAHAMNDPVPVANSILLAAALNEMKVPVELHLYSTGGHGFGLRPTDDPCTRWPARCEEWMRRQGYFAEKPR